MSVDHRPLHMALMTTLAEPLRILLGECVSHVPESTRSNRFACLPSSWSDCRMFSGIAAFTPVMLAASPGFRVGGVHGGNQNVRTTVV